MKTLVIYTDERDEICISYAKEVGGMIYVLKYGRKKPSNGAVFEGKNLMDDIQNFKGRADVIIFRKNTSLGKIILDLRKDLKGLKLLVVD